MRVIAAYASVILIWSTTPLAVKFSTDSLSFVSAAGLRMLVAGAICLLIMMAMGRLPRWHGAALRSYAAANLGVFGAMSLVYAAVLFIPSGLVSVMFGLAPMMSGLLARPLLGEAALTVSRWIALLLALLGLGSVFAGTLHLDAAAWPGLLLCFGAMLLFSLSSVLIKRSGGDLTPLEHTTGSLLMSLPLYFACWLLLDGQLPQSVSTLSLGAVGYLAIVGSVLGFMLYFFILQKLAATQVALIPLITPVFALALGAWIADEAIAPSTVIGGGVILAALALYQVNPGWMNSARRPVIVSTDTAKC